MVDFRDESQESSTVLGEIPNADPASRQWPLPASRRQLFAHDVARANRIRDARQLPPDEAAKLIQVDGKVRSTYDSRPLNAYDGYFTANIDGTITTPDADNILTFTTTFIVSLGYVFVGRAFKITPRNLYYDGDGNEIYPTISFFVNKISVPNMSNLVVNPGSELFHPAFFIAPQYAVIDVNITYNLGAGTSAFPSMLINLEGNFLLTNDPANLAVTNAVSAVDGKK